MKTNYTVKGTINQENAHFCKSGNTKLGSRVWTFSKLFGRYFYAVTDSEKTVNITGSCGHHCENCAPDDVNGLPPCYVAKSYRYTSVVKGHTENSAAIRMDVHAAFERLRGQLRRAKKQPDMVRINQSGEIESVEEFNEWCATAKEFPNTFFWLYTKAFEYIKPALDADMVPENLVVNFSIWHEYGLEEYAAYKNNPSVAAFVYDDHTFDYSAYGLEIKVYCPAYDADGKMDHSKTCDKCRLCTLGGIVIGCHDH